MHGENLLINDGSDRQAVETIGESFPQFDVVPSFAFIVEPIYAINRSAFMVAPQNEEIFGILDLICQEQADRLQRLFSSVNVITEEKVVCFGWEPSVFEQTEQIVILAVNISTDLRCSYRISARA